jgi:hypothetical protein
MFIKGKPNLLNIIKIIKIFFIKCFVLIIFCNKLNIFLKINIINYYSKGY